ncbi:MAG: YciI family protein [Acidobacteria bacterium]|nr:YciI family protein [Acidobacteriota bacterium]
MQYFLLIYSEESGWAKMSQAEQEQAQAAYGAFTEALNSAGIRVGSHRLQPSTTSTTVKVANGKTQVLDGPFIDSKEQLGGYYLIDVPDLDAALSWAARCPGASHGTVEVRPSWCMPS